MLVCTHTNSYTDNSSLGLEYEMKIVPSQLASFDTSCDNESSSAGTKKNLSKFDRENNTSHHASNCNEVCQTFEETDTDTYNEATSASSFESIAEPAYVLKPSKKGEHYEISFMKAVQDNIKSQMLLAMQHIQTKHHPEQTKIGGSGPSNDKMSMNAVPSVDHTASMSVMTSDDYSLLTTEMLIDDHTPTTKHSNKSCTFDSEIKSDDSLLYKTVAAKPRHGRKPSNKSHHSEEEQVRKAIQAGIKAQLHHAMKIKKTREYPVLEVQQATNKPKGTHNKLVMNAVTSVDDTASLSVMMSDDASLRTAETQEKRSTTNKHSNKSFSFEPFQSDTISTTGASYVSAQEKERRYNRLHTYGQAQQQVRRELQVINRIKGSQREIIFKLRLEEKQKRMKSMAPPLPPLEDRGRRIHDTYASKKNDAGRKLREQIERKNEKRDILRQVGWK